MYMTKKGLTTEERFWLKVEKTETCWLWTACIDVGGYGRFRLDGETEYAHRFSYDIHKGLPEDDRVVDHICRVRNCVNPDHLRLLTLAENFSYGRKGMFKEECIRGHDLTQPENLYHIKHTTGQRKDTTSRACKQCNTDAKRRYRAHKRAAGISV